MKVLLIFGTRPEAIKMAPLYKEFKNYPETDVKVCVTAQHRSMLDQVLNLFEIIPDYDLDIMKSDQTISSIVSTCITKIDEILKKEHFDYVLVHGDTSTTLAASLAAYFNQIKIGHVEAGLRTYNKYSPFPEEINRCVAGVVADLHFTPTTMTYENLKKENKDLNNVFIVGNTALDVFKYTISENYQNQYLKTLKKDNFLILLTTHRRENWGDPMENIFKAVNELCEKYQNIKILYPVHLNPNIQKLAQEYFKNNVQVILCPPLDVIDFHNITKRSYIVLTDSGGIQEEASGLKKPVLVLRDTTERPEGVESGILKLVGTNTKDIVSSFSNIFENDDLYLKMTSGKNPYGDGTTSKQIIEILKKDYEKS